MRPTVQSGRWWDSFRTCALTRQRSVNSAQALPTCIYDEHTDTLSIRLQSPSLQSDPEPRPDVWCGAVSASPAGIPTSVASQCLWETRRRVSPTGPETTVASIWTSLGRGHRAGTGEEQEEGGWGAHSVLHARVFPCSTWDSEPRPRKALGQRLICSVGVCNLLSVIEVFLPHYL